MIDMDASGSLGILMLDTRFPRLPGDAGHPGSWRMPVRLHVIRGAAPRRIVQAPTADDLQPFITAAQDLQRAGVRAITTSCGFLVRWQAALQAAVSVPVWSSSLLAVSGLDRPGVLTVDAASLGPAEWAAAGAPVDTPVQGLEPGCHLQRVLLDNPERLDPVVARDDVLQAARALLARHPEVRNLVLECTNLPPYAEALAADTARPVHHLVSWVHTRWASL